MYVVAYLTTKHKLGIVEASRSVEMGFDVVFDRLLDRR